jgi:hypothetical protein
MSALANVRRGLDRFAVFMGLVALARLTWTLPHVEAPLYRAAIACVILAACVTIGMMIITRLSIWVVKGFMD